MRSESMLGRQDDYAAMRGFRDPLIFHLPYHIFHLSLSEASLPTMTNEKCDKANGKWKMITPEYYSVIAYETTEMEGDGRTFCHPPALPWERHPSLPACPPAPSPAVSGTPKRPSIPRPLLTASRES